MKSRRFHVNIRCADVEAAVADFTDRLRMQPVFHCFGQSALWRDDQLNFELSRCEVGADGLVQFGWELVEADDGAGLQDAMSEHIDCSGSCWRSFTLDQQLDDMQKNATKAPPEAAERGYSLKDLRHLMARLRDISDGCPWDLRQDFASLLPCTIEETHELADAVFRQDWPHVAEELGDYLFQAVFYCQLAEERGLFVWEDIVGGITRKLLRRHPHVFPDGTLASRRPAGEAPDQAVINAEWQRIKAEEKRLGLTGGASGKRGVPALLLDSVSAGQAPLLRAEKLQKKAAEVGFDWSEIGPVLAKLHEELEEFAEELKTDRLGAGEPNRARIVDEMGDVLFCCVNLARFVGVDAEDALRHANHKFTSRFEHIERSLLGQGISRSDWLAGTVSLQQMDELWDEAKMLQRSGQSAGG